MEKKTISHSKYVFSKMNLAIIAICLLVIGYGVYDTVQAETHYEYSTALWFAGIAAAIAVGVIGYSSYQWHKEGLGRP